MGLFFSKAFIAKDKYINKEKIKILSDPLSAKFNCPNQLK